MRKSFVLLFGSTMIAAGVALAEDMPGMDMGKKGPAPTSQPAAAAVDAGNTVCPITGEKVGDSKVAATYDGKTYHFCCGDCPAAFNKDPGKYVKAMAADPAKYGLKP